jgi:hypothetical protein
MICYDSLITWSLIFSTASGLCQDGRFSSFPVSDEKSAIGDDAATLAGRLKLDDA